MHAIGDRAIVKQRSKHVLHRNEHGVKALHVEECLLLPAKEASGISSAVAEERTAKEASASSADSWS
jgi:hypothetical protein